MLDAVGASGGTKSVICLVYPPGEETKMEINAIPVGTQGYSFNELVDPPPKPNRSPGQDLDIVETVAGDIDRVMYQLGFLDASSWIVAAHRSKEALYDQIDKSLVAVDEEMKARKAMLRAAHVCKSGRRGR